MSNSLDLAQWLEEHAIRAELIKLTVHTPTVEDAARAVEASVERIVKTLLFLVDDKPVVAIACGTGHIDRRTISAHFGVGRKRVKLADGETVMEITGYPVGAVPPFGQRQRLPTLIDSRVMAQSEVYAGGGAIDTLLKVTPKEIVRVTGAIELDLIGAMSKED
jgi:Cys-tRNA(Pro) deacylase